MSHIAHVPTTTSPGTPPEGTLREQAILQIERRRRFWVDFTVATLVMLMVTVVWAVSEYNNAGGWPTEGFSQSSGVPDVWNIWIVYPLLAYVFFVTVDGVKTFVRRPITESAIRREMRRQSGQAGSSGTDSSPTGSSPTHRPPTGAR